MQVCPDMNSYKTYDNAYKKLKRELGDALETGDVRYVIIAQADGRFSPAILSSSDIVQQYGLASILHSGIAVIG